MERRKRKTIAEINLTPLLDVLFSILFIVMMTGVQKETTIQEEYQQQMNQMQENYGQQIEQARQEVFELEQQVTIYENQMSSYDKYQTEAVIITVNNIVKENKHYLVIKQGLDLEEIETIQLGISKTENTKIRICDKISELVEETDNQPVYIVFYCNKKTIYTTEYRAITEAFYELQAKYKEVFFTVMEENR